MREYVDKGNPLYLRWEVKHYWRTAENSEIQMEKGNVTPPKVLNNPWMWVTKCRRPETGLVHVPSSWGVYPTTHIDLEKITIKLTGVMHPTTPKGYEGQLIIRRPYHADSH